MRLRGAGVTFTFGMPVAGGESVTESGIYLPALAAPALPTESDSPQLVAAERLGLFAYPDAADHDCMKGHDA